MSQEVFRPKVLIVGAGLGGIALAAILERAAIPYEIFEKASASRPLGSAISLGPGVMPVFTQLGIIDQVLAKGKVAKESYMYDDRLRLVLRLDYYTVLAERFGWPNYIISRPVLYNILLSLIPLEKIHLGKRLLSHYETGDGIIIRTSDNKTHHGHILIGADGAYSGVRQSLYEQIAKRGALPASDKQPLKYSSICLVGQTWPLNRTTFAPIDDECCSYEAVLSRKKSVVCVTFTTADKTVCWMVVEMLSQETSRIHDNFRASEWGPEAAMAMSKEIRSILIRKGMTMGDLIDVTPKEVICKVMLEEKLFETWTDGRTALLGDACHKMAPNAGLGFQSAMFDAVILANHINTLTTNSLPDIENALRAYRNERYPLAKEAVATSASLANIVKQNIVSSVGRKLLKHIPRWLWYTIRARISGYRPQISFLPLVQDKGTHPPRHQSSLAFTRPDSGRVV